MRGIDLNADVGEVLPEHNLDAQLMPWLSSCNIACAAHAGSLPQMRHTVQLALQHGVAIGAHPGYADRAHMGRIPRQLGDAALRALLLTQLELLANICAEEGAVLRHVKTHGALYNQSARDLHMALVISAAIREFSPQLCVVGLAGSAHVQAAQTHGLRVLQEVFADRRYEADGSLTPRTHPQALIDNEQQALQQVLDIVSTGRVQARTGEWVTVQADTVCLHGDGAEAVLFARRLREMLEGRGMSVRAG